MTVEVGDLAVVTRNGQVVIRRCHDVVRGGATDEPFPLWRDVGLLEPADAHVLADDIEEAASEAGGVGP